MIGTIQDRGYVFTKGQALVPTWLAFAVTRLLEEHFGNLVDYEFTASMEEDLDRDRRRRGGPGRVAEALLLRRRRHLGRRACASLVERPRRHRRPGDLDDPDRRRHGRARRPLRPVRRGVVPGRRPGRRVADGAEPPRAPTITDDMAPDEMTADKARELLEAAADGGKVLGKDPETGREIVAKAGRYGPYVTEVLAEATAPKGKRQGQAPHGVAVQGHGRSTRSTLETALQLLVAAARRRHRRRGRVEITAQNGRYGPYLKKGTDSRSLTASSSSSTSRSTRRSRSTPSPSSGAGLPPRRRSRSSAPTRSAASRSSSRTAASVPTSPTARPTRRCARATTPSDHARARLSS